MVLSFTKLLLNERLSLSKIWLAAHYEKKVKRNQVFEVDIVRSVQDILNAEIFFDLRISGHLLVGIVKIHSRKCKYLLTECSDTLYQVKLFRVGVIDLPDSLLTARHNDITLPELFDNFDTIGNDAMDVILSSNQSRIEDITLRETHESLCLLNEMDYQFDGNEFYDDFIHNFEKEISVFDEKADLKCGKPKEIDHCLDEPSVNRNLEVTENHDTVEQFNEILPPCDINNEIVPDDPSHCIVNDAVVQRKESMGSPILLNQDNELHSQSVKPVSSALAVKKRKQKKRKLTIDFIKAMSYDVIKKQLLDTSDITSALELSPTTKRLVILKEIGRAENLFCLPGQKILNSSLMHLYKRHLKTQKIENDSFTFEESQDENSYNLREKLRLEKSKEQNLDIETDISLILDEECTLNSQDLPALENNSMNDCETNLGLNVAEKSHVDSSKISPTNFGMNLTDEIQDTQVSKTSDEKWEYAFQQRIFQFLQELRMLLKDKVMISFFMMVEGKKRFQVAQRFLCLLMLKKFQFISLEQGQSFRDILIRPSVNFNRAKSNEFEFIKVNI